MLSLSGTSRMHMVDLFFNELPHLRRSRMRSLLASSVLTLEQRYMPPQSNGFRCYGITSPAPMHHDAVGKDFYAPSCVAISKVRLHFTVNKPSLPVQFVY